MSKTDNNRTKKSLLTSTAVILAALVVVVAGNAVLWNKRAAKNADITSLTGQISQVAREAKSVPAPAPDLQARLADATANLTAAQAVLPPSFDRDAIIEYIIGLSRECHVEVLPIAAGGWTTVSGNQTNQVLSLTATVAGTYAQTTDFINKLQHGAYKALVIPEMSLTQTAGASTFAADNTTVSARMTVNVYAAGPSGAKGTVK
jgi:Tfp pilus assembly protein PilN